jgi:hypothetical protein
LAPMGGGRWWGKGVRGWIQCKECVHVHVSAKVIPAETIPGIEGGGNEGQQQRGWIQVWYIWCIVRTFVNATMYSHPAQQQREKVSKQNKTKKNHILNYFNRNGVSVTEFQPLKQITSSYSNFRSSYRFKNSNKV